MTRREVPPRRSAFTLVELLVVIAIIAVLVSLTAAAVLKFMGKGAELQTQNEILKMSDGLSTFKTQFNVDYIPSRFVLRERYDATTLQNATGLERASLNFLSRMFGNRFNPYGPHDWTGQFGGPQNVPGGTAATQPIFLEGQECLVFFLGGVPVIKDPNEPAPKAVTGFSSSPTSPTTPGGDRRGPFFEFKGNRLRLGGPGLGSSGGRMLVYLDLYAYEAPKPYAFFSSAKAGYNQWGSSDCSSLGLSPYVQTTAANGQQLRYHNHDGFQIISAGSDEQFGPGGLLRPGQGALDQFTWDNKTNFSKGHLGTDGWE